MAQFLILNKNNTHSDPIKDDRSCYKRGDIVVVKDDAHQWGSAEGLPDFVLLKVPTIDYENAVDKMKGWEQTLDYSVIAHDPVLDRARLKTGS